MNQKLVQLTEVGVNIKGSAKISNIFELQADLLSKTVPISFLLILVVL